ncbi:MAG: SagB/ThcOx family dehydrogenase [Planctomycetota bacterium]|jgi:SagB-type dehydrogenase family enzyme
MGSVSGKTRLLMELPPPTATGSMPLEQAIARRRSIRSYTGRALTPAQMSQLCWAGQGITEPKEALRAAPSAGALYPIELFVATADGVGHYHPKDHTLTVHLAGDVRPKIQRASLDQEMIGQAWACFVIAAVVGRVGAKYGDSAEQYTLIEVGHVAQNLLLEAEALDLAGVPVGAFHEDQVMAILGLPRNHRAYYLVPIGHPA